ncbi:MAG TPA: aldehyde dehydrogenase family protein [Natronosporangium sp.]
MSEQSVKRYGEHYIGGAWRPGSGPVLASVNPYTGRVWYEFTAASPADVDAAVTAAREAFDGWRRTPGYQRGRLVDALADVLEEHAEQLAEIETRDNGKIYRENLGQIRFAARVYRYMAGAADKIHGETKPLDNYATVDFTTREPIGVAALITAWNSPLQLLANKLPAALAAGNTVVVKPSEHTTASTVEFIRLAERVGFPPGVINLVTGAGETGQALTSHPEVGVISFTGGVETAKAIAAAAAQHVVPCILELGGKSANIIFDDANLDAAIPGAVAGVFAAAGQTCIAGSRLFVHERVYDQVVTGVAKRAEAVKLGDPFDPSTQVGPMAHRGQHRTTLEAIAKARTDGAVLAAGGGAPAGREDSLFVEPTVFSDVVNTMSLAQHEVFGPVLAVIPFTDTDEVIRQANDTRYGLAAGLWTQDITKAHWVAKELRAGTVWVNTFRTSAAQAPFGGFRQSGYSRERGIEGLLEYTRVKNTMIDISGTVRDPFVLGT